MSTVFYKCQDCDLQFDDVFDRDQHERETDHLTEAASVDDEAEEPTNGK